MDITSGNNNSRHQQKNKTNQNIQVYVRVRPLNARERCLRSTEVVDVLPPREILTRHLLDPKLTKKFSFDRTFGLESRQVEVYSTVVAPLIEEVLSGYNCTVFAYGQTGTGKTHTMVGNECAELKSSWEDDSEIGIIPRALNHLFDELRMMKVEYTMRISYLELYNEELCDLLSTDDNTKIRIFDDSTKKGSVIVQGLEEIPVHSKDDVYKLLEKGKERRKTASTLMNAQSSRSHTVFSILVHIRENGIEGEDMLKIGKLNLVDLAGSENVSKAGNEKAIRVRETVNINQSLLTLGRVITSLVERAPHIPYRESKLTRLLQESLGGRAKTSIIATISPGHKDIEETLSTLEYAHRAKNIQNKPEVNQKLTKKTVLKEYTEEIDKLKRDLMAARDKNGIYLHAETYNEMTLKMDSQNRELNEKMLLLKALKDELANKEKIFNEVSMSLVEKTELLKRTSENLTATKGTLVQTKKVLNSTKRRYKVKKALLDSHVKTEKELTTQATQILEVADLATNDTHQLHSTIERRKDVDKKILTACEIFTERMQENFEMLDGSLNDFVDKHNLTAQNLNEELSNCTKVHNRLLKNSEQNIQNISNLCLDSFTASTNLHTQFTQIVNNLSAEQRDQLIKMLQNLQKREAEMKSQIHNNLLELQANNEQQTLTVDRLFKIIGETVENSVKDLNQHTHHMQQQLSQIIKLAEQNFERIKELQIELDNDSTLVAQEQTLINNFVQEMQQIRELRVRNNTKMGEVLHRLNTNVKKSVEEAQQSIETATTFDEKRLQANERAKQHMDKEVETVLLNIDRNMAKCSTIQMQIDNLCEESSKELLGFMAAESKHCTDIQNACDASATELKRMQVDRQQHLNKSSTEIYTAINEETQRINGHLAIAGNCVSELKNHLTDYTKLHKEHVQNCNVKLAQFQQSELKIYSSTGATPLKREFVYPRVLAATTPHQEIVKRIRQEHNWSELDSTIIDECSEGEEELNSVQEFSEAETILNSTPVDGEDSKRNGSDLSNLLTSNSNNKSNNPITPVLIHSKNSTRNSPLSDIENKENLI